MTRFYVAISLCTKWTNVSGNVVTSVLLLLLLLLLLLYNNIWFSV